MRDFAPVSLLATNESVLALPDIIERAAAMGNEPVGSTPVEFDKFIRDEIPKWAKVIKEAKITLAP